MRMRTLLSVITCAALLGCRGKHPVEPPSDTDPPWSPVPVAGPPNPDSEFLITVDGTEFFAPARVSVTLHNASTRDLMYWPQCAPNYEVWDAGKWAFPFRVCYEYWPGVILAAGESRMWVLEFAGSGAFRVSLPVSLNATALQQTYRSAWWIVR